MAKSNRRMRIRHTPAQKIKMKTTTKVLVAIGFSALLLGMVFFVYINVSNVETSKAGIAGDRIIMAANPLSGLEIKSVSVLPVEQQPLGRNEPGIENKRKAMPIQ